MRLLGAPSSDQAGRCARAQDGPGCGENGGAARRTQSAHTDSARAPAHPCRASSLTTGFWEGSACPGVRAAATGPRAVEHVQDRRRERADGHGSRWAAGREGPAHARCSGTPRGQELGGPLGCRRHRDSPTPGTGSSPACKRRRACAHPSSPRPPNPGHWPRAPTVLPSAPDSCNSDLCCWRKGTCTVSELLILSHSLRNRHLCIRSLAAARLTCPHTRGWQSQEPLHGLRALPGHRARCRWPGQRRAHAGSDGGRSGALCSSRQVTPLASISSALKRAPDRRFLSTTMCKVPLHAVYR